MACTILIVDDSATTRAMIKRIIQVAGIPTEALLEAPNGVAALQLLRRHAVDLVLADLHMPEMTGVELTHQMLADPALAPIPIVIVSADPNQEKITALQQQGVRGHLRKPFTPEALRNLVHDILGVVHA
jgi:two-component system chemotaxis response regulator CheY